MNGAVKILPGLALLLVARPSPVLSERESPALLFAKGNAAYQRGEFHDAEQLYMKVLAEGIESGPLYYNLGNACFKEKKLGDAIYYWEKARQKMPDDPDVLGNLDFANLLIVDRVEVPADPLPIRLIRRARDSLSVIQASWAAAVLFVLANVLFSVYLLAGNSRLCYRALMGSLVAGATVLVLATSLAWRIQEQNENREAIVVEQKADVRSGPGADNITVFTAHEGLKVRVRGEANGWYQVSLPNGWSGWLQQNSIRVL